MNTFRIEVQVDPSEDTIYTPGSGRHVFQTGGLKFGVAICHEGWRYLLTWGLRPRLYAYVRFAD